jgi:hypothetical protein
MQDLTHNFDPIKAIESVVSQRTQHEKDEWEKYQEEQRAKLTLLDGRAMMGVRQVEIALRELENGESDFEYTRLAEGYALQGEFQKAVELTRDALKRSEYQAVLNATEMDCPCNPKHKFIRDIYPQFSIWCCASCSHLRKC